MQFICQFSNAKYQGHNGEIIIDYHDMQTNEMFVAIDSFLIKIDYSELKDYCSSLTKKFLASFSALLAWPWQGMICQ